MPVSDAQATEELKSFFEQFYEARSLSRSVPIDLEQSSWLAAGSYAAYTIPLLERAAAEEPPRGLEGNSIHGHLHPRADPPQRATYEFRVHRHFAEQWLAVDFFRPDLNRGVTDLAGATVIVPEWGHG